MPNKPTPERAALIERAKVFLHRETHLIATTELANILSDFAALIAAEEIEGAVQWVSLDQWPASPDEFTGAYWSGIALLKSTQTTSSGKPCNPYLSLVAYDAGVSMWWGDTDDETVEKFNDIDPERILYLYYLPNPPKGWDKEPKI